MNTCSRRNFIKGTLATAGALGAGVGCHSLSISKSNELEGVERLRAKLKGRLILPTDSSYETIRRVFYWNAATERRPRAIVRCAHQDDVLRAVEFARRHNLQLATRAGGHSHLGWGTSNGLVIDLSPMKGVTIDPSRPIARCQGGVLSGEVARAAGRYGLAKWANDSMQLLRPASQQKIYANFQTYHTQNGAAAVYGVNHSRLLRLKQKHDPQNIFHRNSNIEPSVKP